MPRSKYLIHIESFKRYGIAIYHLGEDRTPSGGAIVADKLDGTFILYGLERTPGHFSKYSNLGQTREYMFSFHSIEQHKASLFYLKRPFLSFYGVFDVTNKNMA